MQSINNNTFFTPKSTCSVGEEQTDFFHRGEPLPDLYNRQRLYDNNEEGFHQQWVDGQVTRCLYAEQGMTEPEDQPTARHAIGHGLGHMFSQSDVEEIDEGLRVPLTSHRIVMNIRRKKGDRYFYQEQGRRPVASSVEEYFHNVETAVRHPLPKDPDYIMAKDATDNAFGRYKAIIFPLEGIDNVEDFPPAKLRTKVVREVEYRMATAKAAGIPATMDAAENFALASLHKAVEAGRRFKQACLEKSPCQTINPPGQSLLAVRRKTSTVTTPAAAAAATTPAIEAPAAAATPDIEIVTDLPAETPVPSVEIPTTTITAAPSVEETPAPTATSVVETPPEKIDAVTMDALNEPFDAASEKQRQKRSTPEDEPKWYRTPMPEKKIIMAARKRRTVVRDFAIDIGGGNSVAIVKAEFVNKNGERVVFDRLQRGRKYGDEGKEMRWDQNASTIPKDIQALALLYGISGDELADIGREVDRQAKLLFSV